MPTIREGNFYRNPIGNPGKHSWMDSKQADVASEHLHSVSCLSEQSMPEAARPELPENQRYKLIVPRNLVSKNTMLKTSTNILMKEQT